MKTFLCSIALMLVTSSLAYAERPLTEQLNDVVRDYNSRVGKDPVKPTVEIKADEVIITTSDLDQTKDAITLLPPAHSKKTIRVVVAPVKRTIENGRPMVSFGKPLSEEFKDALGDIAERYPDVKEARLKNPTDIRAHIAAAEKALSLDGKKPVPLSIMERTYRVTWMGSFEHLSQDMLFEFE